MWKKLEAIAHRDGKASASEVIREALLAAHPELADFIEADEAERTLVGGSMVAMMALAILAVLALVVALVW